VKRIALPMRPLVGPSLLIGPSRSRLPMSWDDGPLSASGRCGRPDQLTARHGVGEALDSELPPDTDRVACRAVNVVGCSGTRGAGSGPDPIRWTSWSPASTCDDSGMT